MPLPCLGGCGLDLAIEPDDIHLDVSGAVLGWRCYPCDVAWRCGAEGC